MNNAILIGMTTIAARAIREPGTMRPDAALLPEVLPTDHIGPTGRPVGELRAELYRRHPVRNVLNIISVWVQSVGVIALAAWIGHPVAWVVAFFLMGRAFALFAILGHEAAHRLLFPSKKVNDVVGRWLVAFPGFVPLDAYRRGHMAHHRDEFGPDEPDLMLYAGYPITRASWHRKLRRDAFGNSGWKNLKGLLGALRSPTSRGVAGRILAVQVVLFVTFGLLWGWWVWPVMWLLPWMTVWRVINRLRAIAEHGGMERSSDRRLTTHHVHQGWTARFWMVPFNTGWHLAHHLDVGVPFQNLPEFHRELVRCGYVVDGYQWPTYRALWRHGSSRPD